MNLFVMVLLSTALLAACGDQSAAIPTTGTYSCDITSGGTHKCIDNTWSGDTYSTASWASQCMTNMGSGGSGCTHAGAVGGCQTTSMTSTDVLTQTEWFYAGDLASLTAACQAAGGMFVSP